MDKELYLEREKSKLFLTTEKLREIMKKYEFLDEYTPTLIHKSARGVCKSADKNKEIKYFEYDSTNDIHISIEMTEVFEKKVKENKKILESEYFLTYEEFCKILGFYPSKKAMNDRCERYLVKNKMYYAKSILGISKDANENCIPIQKIIDLNLDGLKYTSTIIRFLEENNIPYVDSSKLLTKYTGYLIRKEYIENIIQAHKKKHIILNSADRFEIYITKCKAFRSSILKKNKCVDTLDKFEKYIKLRFKTNKKRNELINSFVEITIFFDTYLNKELINYEDKHIREFITLIESEKKYTLLMKEEFIQFYNYYRADKSDISPIYKKEKKITKEVKPYSVGTYIDFYALIFMKNNDEKFIKKVINDRSLAMSALYCALHYTCNWRASQIYNIHLPNIDLLGFKTGRDLLQWLNDGNQFTEEMAIMITNDIKTKVDLYLTKVQKNNELLYFGISRSMVHMIGFLLATCEAHRRSIINNEKKGKSDVEKLITTTVQHKKYHIEVFGHKYNEIFGKRGFINRKANKSYTTYLINKSQELGMGQGLLYAAITRGHVFNCKLFSNQTFIYDDRYIDSSIYDIQLELFERGTFGFTKDILLSISNSDYDNLNHRNKTEEIKNININPYEIEELMKNTSKKRKRVKNILNKVEINKETAKNILKALASEDVYSKQDNSSCLLRAFIKENIDISEIFIDENINNANTKYPCVNKHGGSCFGCDLLVGEIYLLNEVNNKIREISKKIETCENDFEISMYYDIVYNSYRPLLQEAIYEFGPEMVKCFIDTSEVLNIANTIKNKKLAIGGVNGTT